MRVAILTASVPVSAVRTTVSGSNLGTSWHYHTWAPVYSFLWVSLCFAFNQTVTDTAQHWMLSFIIRYYRTSCPIYSPGFRRPPVCRAIPEPLVVFWNSYSSETSVSDRILLYEEVILIIMLISIYSMPLISLLNHSDCPWTLFLNISPFFARPDSGGIGRGFDCS